MDGPHGRWATSARALASVAMVGVLAAGLVAGCDDSSSSVAPGGNTGTSRPAATDPGGSGGAAATTVEVLLATLRDGTRTERADAATELGRLGDPTAVPSLVTALGDEDWDVRGAVAGALGTLGDPTAVEPLLALIGVEPATPDVAEEDLSPAASACNEAVTALGKLGAVGAVPRLLAIAVNPDTTLDAAAAEAAIIAIGPAAVDAVAAELTAAPAGRAGAIAALLARLGDQALAPLLTALRSKTTSQRVAAAEALGAYGSDAVPALIKALGDSKDSVRNAAAASLGSIGAKSATGKLVNLLSDTDTRKAAVRALVAIYADDATPLVKYLKHRSTVQVYRPLIKLGQDDTVSALVTALKQFGTKRMGETYLNAGEPHLEKAARNWAKAHGYYVVPSGGVGEEGWGDR